MIKVALATGINGAFGLNGGLPWKSPLKADMVAFKEYTDGCILIMGRATFESLPCKLRGLKHYVVSSSSDDIIAKNGESPDIVFDLKEHTLWGLLTYIDRYHSNDVCVIGGKQMILDSLFVADSIMHTQIHCIFDYDVSVDIDYLTQKWKLIKQDDHSDRYQYSIKTFEWI